MPDGRPSAPRARLLSLDAYRGLTMAGMVIVNNPGDWGNVYAPLRHAEWHGCTFTDLIFPWFLFIVGVSITLSRTAAAGLRPIVRRAVIIFALGLFLAAFPFFRLGTLRIMGVLQRIALCYLAAALAFRAIERHSRWTDRRKAGTIAAIAAALLVGYWALLMLVPGAHGTAGDLTPEGNLGAVIDRAVFGHRLWKKDWDPEGLLSTIPAIATTLCGVLAGLWLRQRVPPARKIIGLALAGVAGMLAGLAWSVVFPLNKNLWTSSYAVYTAGFGALLLAACYAIIDVAGWRRWAHPAIVLGSNAIALFVLSALLAKALIYVKVPGADGHVVALKTWIYNLAFVPAASAVNASLLFAVANLLVLYAVLWVMYRRGVFLKV